jgi:diaminopimelate decarboxylase
MPELAAVNRIAGELKTRARVGLRINPDVDAKTHAKTTTGKKENKFGLPISRAAEYFREANSLKNVMVTAMDMHLGSPIYSTVPYEQALRKLLSLAEDLKKNGIPLAELDIGGGYGVRYHDQKPFTPALLARKLLPLVRKSGLTLICEPGRYITANSGVLAAGVLYVKKTDVKNFVIVDTGMNDLIRPALYDSYHRIEPAAPSGKRPIVADIVGPICESSDYLGKARRLPEPRPGDILAVMSAGAYGFAMSSNYLSRPRACEILVNGSRASVVRRRESYADLVRGETFAV